MVLGLSRRPKGETDRISRFHLFRRFPLGNPLGRLRKTDLTDNLHFNPSAEPTPQFSIFNFQFSILNPLRKAEWIDPFPTGKVWVEKSGNFREKRQKSLRL